METNTSSAEKLRTFPRPELLDRIGDASTRTWLASPFLSHPIAQKLAEAASPDIDLRLLTALVGGSVQVRALNPMGLALLKDHGWQVRSIRNLHAKVSIIDQSWGLVGSGNLTNAGLGSTEKGNVELGVALNPSQIREASEIYDGWWLEAAEITDDEIARFASLPARQPTDASQMGVGPALEIADPADLESILGAHQPGQRFWAKANYHRRRPDGREWWHRNWISDWRRARYRKGDLILLYLGAKFDGPRRCPAIVRVTGESRYDPEFVAEYDPEARDRWPYVTDIECVFEVPIEQGVPLEAFGVTPNGLQGGYKELSRTQFETAGQHLIAVARR